MDDKEKEMEKKIREFEWLQLLTELRFKKMEELNETVQTTKFGPNDKIQS